MKERIWDIPFFLAILTLVISLFQIDPSKLVYVVISIGLVVFCWITFSKRVRAMLAVDELNKYLKRCENHRLTIEKVIQRMTVEGVNAGVRREYIGRNTSEEEVDSFVTYAMGDKHLSLSRISFRAWSVVSGKKELSFDPIKDYEPSAVKLLRINFEEPLKPNENFHVVVEYNWPGAIGQDDYLSLKLSPYKPAAGAEFEVIFDKNTIPKFCEFRGEDTKRLVKRREEKRRKDGLWLKYVIAKTDETKEDYRLKFRII